MLVLPIPLLRSHLEEQKYVLADKDLKLHFVPLLKKFNITLMSNSETKYSNLFLKGPSPAIIYSIFLCFLTILAIDFIAYS